jgi:hypothetical protein
MAQRLSKDLKNYIVNQAIVKIMAGTMGTGGTASMTIYTGTQPTDADTAPSGTSGTVLCTITGIGWGGSNGTRGATCGTVSFGTSVGYAGTGIYDGTAGWARMVTVGTGFTGSAATFRIDGDCGVAATCSFVIDNASIAVDSVVTVLTCPISAG